MMRDTEVGAGSGTRYCNIREESELRAAIQFAVMQTCLAEDRTSATTMSAAAVTSLSELVYLYARTSLASDLEAFRDHAGRKMINESDVRLAARKAPEEIRVKLQTFCNDWATKQATEAKQEKSKAPLDLQKKSKKNGFEDSDDNITSASSDLDLLEAATSSLLPSATTAAVSKKPEKHGPALNTSDDDSDDSSLEDLLRTRLEKKKKNANTKTDQATSAWLEDSHKNDLSLSDSKPPAKRKPMSNHHIKSTKNRFRLPTALDGNKMDENSGRDNDEDHDDVVVQKGNVCGLTSASQPKSRVEEIMDTMSQDSVMSNL